MNRILVSRCAGTVLAHCLVLGFACGLSTRADAQSGDPPPADPGRVATPCAERAESRRFDFWVGEWEVRGPNGRIAGSSSVQPVAGSCALLENWTDAKGGTGKSLNAFNASAGHWQQFWVGQQGEVHEYRESEWRGGALVFLARDAKNTREMHRMTFSPIGTDGTVVRQFGELSSDGGKSWTVEYDLYYHRRPAP